MSTAKAFYAIALVAGLATTAAAQTDGGGRYRVTITNATAGQTFTPILVATHRPSVSLFTVGEPASEALEDLAEGGSTAALKAALDSNGNVSETQGTTGLLAPGQTVEITIGARPGFGRLSIAAMLIPTNDSFFALEGVRLPASGRAEFEAVAYDAGSEPNTEACADIPGPFCGGEGTDFAENGEGFVHVSRGISRQGDPVPGNQVTEAVHDWRNPVAEIEVRRIADR